MSLRTILPIAAFLAVFAGFAQGAEGEHGPLLNLDFSGSSYQPGWVFKLDPSAGYQFNDHVEIAFGLPVYFVHINSSGAADGLSSRTGIGNAYVDLKFMLTRPDFYFSSTIRATAPSGDVDKGFSTGRVTFDWSNYIERTFGLVTPFGSAGIANTVSDTHFFTRPFTSLGLVGHFEGGVYIQPLTWIGFAGSGYAITPSGEQKVYSNAAHGSSQSSTNPGKGVGRMKLFEDTGETAGTEEITRDHGFSAWVDVMPHPNLTLELGYSRSVSYDYNSLFFSVRFDLARIIRRDWGF